LQWYGKEPFDENVKRKESPGASVDESNAGLSEVAEWLTEPLFVQHTVVPSGTVIVAGWKAKLTMLTFVSPAMQLPAA
jgi:hypothetical protein